MKHEAGEDVSRNEFYKEGKKYQKTQRQNERKWRRERRRRAAQMEEIQDGDDDIALLEGKLKRAELKEELRGYLWEQGIDM